MLKEGSDAPDFTLPDAEGKPWRLSDYRGRVVVLLFYPGVPDAFGDSHASRGRESGFSDEVN